MINSLRIRRIAWQYRGKSTLVLKGRHAGFFSMYFQVLGAYRLCKLNRQKLVVDFDSGPYFDPSRPERSWWSYYFKDTASIVSDIHPDVLSRKECRIIDTTDMQRKLAHLAAAMGRKQAGRLADGIPLRDEIRMRIDEFARVHFANRFVIGLHYRGTDKVIRESVRVEYDLLSRILQRLIDDEIHFHLFVATDESGVLEFLKDLCGERILSLDVSRSGDETPVHLKKTHVSPYLLGLEALMDALLLSECDFLLRCDSNLSQASLFFNPRLETVNLSSLTRKYPGGHASIPETEITAICKKISAARRE
jgi:hypothetical protein